MSRLLSLALVLLPAGASAAPPAVNAVAYRPDGGAVVFGGARGLNMFEVPKGEARGGVASQRVTALAFDRAGTVLAVASAEPGKVGRLGFLAVTDDIGRLGDGKNEVFDAHKDAIYALAFSPDGKTLATAGYDRLIHLWDVPDLTGPQEKRKPGPRLTLKDHSDAVYGLSFHPDGKLLASAGADRAVKVWDAATGKRLYTLGDATDWVYAVAWSPDKKHLAAAGVDKSVRVWAADKDGGKLVNTAFAHEKPVWRVAYSGDGATLFTTGEDRVVKSWDALKLTEKKVFAAQPDAILDFALRADAKQFALARFDGAGVLIDAETGKLAHELLPKKEKKPQGESPVFAQPPPPKTVPPAPVSPVTVVRVEPNGGARGATTRVKVTGQNLDLVTSAGTNVAGIEVKLVPITRKLGEIQLDVTIGPTAPVGAAQLVFHGEGTKSNPITFTVDRFAAVPEAGTTDSARTAMPVKLSSTIVGTIDRAGDVDYFRFEAKVGDQIGAQVVAGEIGSKLDPALVLTDENGAVLAEGTASLGHVVRKNGTYAIGIRDREFRGGADFFYRLHVGDVPVITGVFPLGAQTGRATSVHVSGVNLGAPNGVLARVTVPADAKPGAKVPVPLTGLAAQAVGKAEVVASEFPSVVLDPITGGDVRVPGSADGIFAKPNDAQTATFSAKKGARLVVEVLAQRAGSPVDPVVEILDSAGKPVTLAALRCTAKTSVTFRDHDSRSPGIRLDAWNELAIDDYLFVKGELVRILALPKGPDDDCQFYQTGGQRVGWLGTTPTHHSFGETMYKVELHPPGTTFPPNGMPVFALAYRNDDGGPGYGKDSRLFFDPPADGTYQVRVTDARGAHGPAHAFRVTVRPPRPAFTATANVVGPMLLKGGSVPVNVSIDRADGFDGPVALRLKNLPDGFSAPPTSIEAGQQNTTFPLFARADAALPEKVAVVLVATATIGGKEVARELPLALPAKPGTGDLVTTLRQQAVSIQPGKEARFTVEIARQGKFAGRVPIEVKGLPHGVRVLNIGLNGILITERETTREVVLYAEPWVKPMERPVIVVAKREGTAAEYGAKPLTLTVEK
ncbi:MAG: WD40 repeat domain-containing protein [Planctomycetes bacterium]|nr:WD40 repeat domain-containing protein [Planctomycetota bacterium]